MARWLWKPCAFALVVFVGWSSLVLVDETEYVIVERLGEIVRVYDQPADRGLHFKLPWPVDAVRRFDRRVQLFDPPGREMFTRDRKNVTVDTCLCWRIAAPSAAQPAEGDAGGADAVERPVVQFFRSLGSRETAEARLDSRLRSILSMQVGQVELAELLSVQDSAAGPDSVKTGLLETLAARIRQAVIHRAGEEGSITSRLGIEIVDVRIKRLNLPAGNRQSVFERMKSERRKIADRYRSAGMAENQRIRSRADRQYSDLLARARADAERIRGAAEADAIATLNEVHSADPEFYRVLRTLDAYREILTDRTTLVLSASSPLLRMLTEGIDALPQAPVPSAATGDAEATGTAEERRTGEPVEAQRPQSAKRGSRLSGGSVATGELP